MSRIEAIIGGRNLNDTDTKEWALKLKKKIEHMGWAAMRSEQAVMRTEQATIKSNLETVRTEQATMRSEQVEMKSSLTSVQDSLSRVEKVLATLSSNLATLTSNLAPTETLDLTLSNPPPTTTVSTGNKKRSNLAILVDNQATFNHTLKKVKKEKDDISRSLEALEDAETCTVCLTTKRSVLFLPCGHLVCCGECSKKVDECPMCREVIGNRKTVFM
ncbi:hypothetical protein TrCOL_g7042 [Triparma columacea]|nr:hypothetical protein TrCOL_g7042 [Triparma columacea]